MFAKLLKQEWKDNYKLLSLLCACAFIAGGVAAVLLWLMLTLQNQPIPQSTNGIQNLFYIPIFFGLFIAFVYIGIYVIATQYILLYRFYKSRFTDRGYLMFTLPVKTEYHFLAPAVNMLIWKVISCIIAALAIFMVVGVAMVWMRIAETGLMSEIKDFYNISSSDINFSLSALSFICSLITFISHIASSIACVVIGSTITRNHKVLASIGLLFGVSMISRIASSILGLIPEILMLAPGGNMDTALYLSPVLSCIVPLIIGIVGYILAVKLMKNKLNLP